MATETRKIQEPEKAGETHALPKAMQAHKPGPEPIQEARAAPTPAEQKELNQSLFALVKKHLRWMSTKEQDEEMVSLISAGARLELDDGWAESLITDLLWIEKKYGKSLFSEAILDTVQLFISANKSSNFDCWSHDACHLFEGYLSKGRPALLDRKENLAAAELLINETVARAESALEQGCISRILGPLAAYNLDDPQPSGSGGFSFKPQSLKKLIPLGILSKEDQAFCESESPGQLFEVLVYLAQNKRESHWSRGLFVDVDNTLISTDGTLNQKVICEMNKAKASGMEVTIFTGGSPSSLREKLEELGIEDKLEGFGLSMIQSKAGYRGQKLERLIDDTPPEIQGFAAEEWKTPEEL